MPLAALEAGAPGSARLEFSFLNISDYRHSDITGLTKTQVVPPNKENKRRIMMHFNTGTNTPDQGFLAKITVRDL